MQIHTVLERRPSRVGVESPPYNDYLIALANQNEGYHIEYQQISTNLFVLMYVVSKLANLFY